MTENWKKWEGQVVNGEFQLRQYVGGSDHSAVFLTELGAREPQKAAIKLIAVAPDSAEVQLSRWGLATKLSHPHLMRLFQMGRCQLGGMELLYIVMEYAEEDLSQVLPERSLTPTETRQMLRPVLDALAYVHGKGLVHGHVKPANIMAVNDQLRISSDGLCPVGESNRGLAKPSVYDPPETTSGGISPAADIWSLGMTLVEALTQRLPAWERTGQGEPVLPETVPEPFFDIACHCLRRGPRRRWTAADVAARLQPTSPALRPTTAGLQQRVSATWRYMVPVVAVGLALVAMLAGPRLLSRRPEAQPAPPIAFQPPQPRPEQAPSGTEQSTQRSGDAKPSPSVAKQSPINSASSLRPLAAAAIPTDGLGQGEVLRQVLPDVPQSARDTIRGTVRVSVRVAVDPSGSVVGATLDSPGPSQYFARLAMGAARRWQFTPAQVDAENVSREWILRFEFGRSATNVFPAQATP